MNETAMIGIDTLTPIISNALKTLIDEHPKAARLITFGGLTAVFGSAFVFELTH